MSKPTQQQSPSKKSKKKLILIGAVFVMCALLLKRDAH